MRSLSPRRRALGIATAAVLLVARAVPSGAVSPQPPPLPHRVWYVDNTSAAGGDGSLVAPFDRLWRAAHAADVGDIIYVFHGDGTDRGLDEGIRLRPYQRLIGSGVTFQPPSGEAVAAGEPPTVGGRAEPAVTLADHASVEGFRLVGNGAAVVLGRHTSDVRLASLRVDGGGAAAAGILLDGVQRAALENVTVTGAAHAAVLAAGSGGITLQGCHVERAGSAEGDAALLVRDPSGDLTIATSELSAAAGAAIRVDASGGEPTITLQGVSLAADDGPGRVRAIDLRLAGQARVAFTATALTLTRPRGEGVAVALDGDARLRLELTAVRYADAQTASTNALQVDVRGAAEATLALRNDDLRASDTVAMLSASGHGRIGGVLDGNTLGGNILGETKVGGSAPARGLVLLLGDRAESALVLMNNHLAGQRAEAFYGVAASQSRLALDAHDNEVAPSAAFTAAPIPSFLLETRDQATVCLTLRGNRVGDGSGGGPSLALRQAGDSSLALSGFEAAAAEPAGQRLAAANRLGRIEIEIKPGRTLTSANAVQCPVPATAPSEPAVAQQVN